MLVKFRSPSLPHHVCHSDDRRNLTRKACRFEILPPLRSLRMTRGAKSFSTAVSPLCEDKKKRGLPPSLFLHFCILLRRVAVTSASQSYEQVSEKQNLFGFFRTRGTKTPLIGLLAKYTKTTLLKESPQARAFLFTFIRMPLGNAL